MVQIRKFAMAVVIAALWAWAAVANSAAAQQDPPLPSPSLVCPAIDEDGMLCSADLLSGNCSDFVAAAERLGALYRDELAALPGSEQSLKTTMWWGCGPGNLEEVTKLLVRIGSPHALAALATEPYASISVAQASPSVPPPGPPSPSFECDDLASALERNACIGTRLQAARAENQGVLARCRDLVPEALRDDFIDSQTSFQILLPVRCDAQATGMDDKTLKSFVRSRCLVQALTDNTRGMLAAHPECRAPR